jgi:hypothetical protein
MDDIIHLFGCIYIGLIALGLIIAVSSAILLARAEKNFNQFSNGRKNKN